MIFVPKCIKIIFFNFLKIIFEISISNDPKHIYKKLIFNKKNFKFFKNTGCPAFLNGLTCRVKNKKNSNFDLKVCLKLW